MWVEHLSNPVFWFSLCALIGAGCGLIAAHLGQSVPVRMKREWDEMTQDYLVERGLPKPVFSDLEQGHASRLRQLMLSVCGLGMGLLVAWTSDDLSVGLPLLGFLMVLLVLSEIDLQAHLLPDAGVYPLLWAGLILSAFGLGVPLEDAVLGAAGGYGALWLMHTGVHIVSGRDAMGFGDFKLIAAIGAWLGWQPLLLVFVSACVLGVVVQIGLRQLSPGREIPFGPYLTGGTLFVICFGDNVLPWLYLI